MKIAIDVPEKSFKYDINNKFQDFFGRLKEETREHMDDGTSLLCGTYELETIQMLMDAFRKMETVPEEK